MSASIKILDWRPLTKGALRGFAKIELPSGMLIADVTILSGNNGPWASPPSKPQVGRDGAVIKDAAGKARYTPIIEFASKDVRDRWSNAVIEALRAAHPGALA